MLAITGNYLAHYGPGGYRYYDFSCSALLPGLKAKQHPQHRKPPHYQVQQQRAAKGAQAEQQKLSPVVAGQGST